MLLNKLNNNGVAVTRCVLSTTLLGTRPG